jgi:N-formylmaleamate deformylase
MTPKLRFYFKLAAFIAALIFFASLAFGKEASYTAFTVKVTGKGQPILLIPGATCSGDEWNETVARYKERYECHVFTLAGYAGTTPLPAPPYLSTITTQLKQYIADKSLHHVILIGHSIGGFLSLRLATEMKADLDKVLVVDALPFFAGVYNPNAPTTFSTELANETLAEYTKLDDKAFKANQLKAAQFLCRDSTYWDMIATWGAASDRKTFAYTITEMMTNDMRSEVAKIRVPVLVLGAYCAIPGYASYTRDGITRTYVDQYKACTTCTVHIAEDKTKHFVMYDNPEWYFAEADNFLKH